MRSQKGITLVALIITIIVLLILAVVTIAAISDEGGVIQQSEAAIDKHEEAVSLQNDTLKGYANGITNYLNK